MKLGQPFIIAHRGASNFEHENTLKAFAKAIELGADYIETDVRKTADGVLILHHDSTVGRLRIKKTKYWDLRKAAQKRNFDIPTLHDLIKPVKGKIKLDIELKEKGYESKVTNVLKGSLSYKDFVITSFYDSAIKAVKAYDKKIICGLLCDYFRVTTKIGGPFKKAILAKADFIAPNFRLLKPKFIKKAEQNSLPIWAWTIDSPKKITEYSQNKAIKAIITNVPDATLLVKKTFGGKHS